MILTIPCIGRHDLAPTRSAQAAQGPNSFLRGVGPCKDKSRPRLLHNSHIDEAEALGQARRSKIGDQHEGGEAAKGSPSAQPKRPKITPIPPEHTYIVPKVEDL